MFGILRLAENQIQSTKRVLLKNINLADSAHANLKIYVQNKAIPIKNNESYKPKLISLAQNVASKIILIVQGLATSNTKTLKTLNGYFIYTIANQSLQEAQYYHQLVIMIFITSYLLSLVDSVSTLKSSGIIGFYTDLTSDNN